MIQTVSGPLLVRFPTRAIQGLRQGDEVLLKLDLTTASRPFPATSPEALPQPKPNPGRDGVAANPFRLPVVERGRFVGVVSRIELKPSRAKRFLAGGYGESSRRG